MNTKVNPVLQPQLEIDNVTISYGDMAVVKNASLTLKAGEIGCLLGPSGCGKTTLLRAIAGFEPLYKGRIRMRGRVLSTDTARVPVEQRNIGMVFQDVALFPHLTIADNIAFGIRHWSKQKQQQRITELLELVGLPDIGQRYPHALSGGQQQRVALARAMAPKPQLLLMDEPFSGLDANLRETLVPEVREILLREKMSALLVTHDQMEAFAIADQIAVMQNHCIQQSGTPFSIYHEPDNRFVADFVGMGEFLHGWVEDAYSVKTALGVLQGRTPHGFAQGAQVEVLIRPDDIQHADDAEYTAIITRKWFRGSHYLYYVTLGSGETLPCITSCHHDHDVGEPIGLRITLDHLVVLPYCDPEQEVCELQPTEVTQAILPNH
ncbi:ABC transporter ATP-binding protein [Pontibacter sp. JAM-7]|uniref:ABC transporter ATP-binding protein n=1 Tax=Pontibacter sp. JAM-7 TaxID=3366581 RepID=UPI003AF92AA4